MKPIALHTEKGVLLEVTSPSPDIIQIAMYPLLKEPDPPYPLVGFDSYLDMYLDGILHSISERIKEYRAIQ